MIKSPLPLIILLLDGAHRPRPHNHHVRTLFIGLAHERHFRVTTQNHHLARDEALGQLGLVRLQKVLHARVLLKWRWQAAPWFTFSSSNSAETKWLAH